MKDSIQPGNAALFYTPEPYRTAGPNHMGRNSAGASFLRAMALHGPRTLHCFSETRAEFDEFSKDVRRFGSGERKLVWLPRQHPERLADPGLLFYPGPRLPEFAWQRRLVGDGTYSLCGITHTISTAHSMDLLGNCFSAPVMPWDALICTSEPTRMAVRSLMQDWRAFYRDRFGDCPEIPMQLPVIPLGVHTGDFAPGGVSDEQVLKFRRETEIAPDEKLVLFVGRLSHNTKGNPLPMFLALERAARLGRKKIHLLMYGRFQNTPTRDAFVSGAAQFAPGIRTTFLDGRDELLGRCAWRAADIFCSFSDNIQESFGLTIIEAMAAGLPLVVSDWDGYRDTVVEGVNGFRIPTTMTAPGHGEAVMKEYALERLHHDHFVGLASHGVGIDIEAASSAIRVLLEDDSRRKLMGEASRVLARKRFDWQVVLDQYRKLWGELESAREQSRPATARHPGRPDPFRMFRRHPTSLLEEDVTLEAGPTRGSHDPATMLSHPLVSFVASRLAPPSALLEMIEDACRTPGTTLGDLRRKHPQLVEDQVDWTIAWLIKMGFLKPGRDPR